jgi:hypothetical protein
MKRLHQYFSGLALLCCMGLPGAHAGEPLSIDGVRAQYPHARISIVDYGEYQRLLRQARAAGLDPVILAEAPVSPLESSGEGGLVADSPTAAVVSSPPGDSLCDSTHHADSLRCPPQDSLSDTAGVGSHMPEEEQAGPVKPQTADERALNNIGIFLTDINSHKKKKKSESETEWAELVLVAIGTVVVVGFLVLGAKVFYDMVVNKESFPVWRDFSLTYSHSSRSMGGGDYPDYAENSSLLSGRFALGWQRDVSAVGVGAEIGYMDVSVIGSKRSEDLFSMNGYYLLFGPALRFGKLNPMALKLSFYNGTANRSSVGLISQARADLQHRIRGPFYLGVHFGAFYADIDYSDGYVLKDWDVNNDFTLLYGVHLGYAF